jgi:SAM-dependent methyltransferase
MPRKEWFETWFNSPDYLELYKHRNDADAGKLVTLLERNVSIPKKAKVLDLACGNGRHSAVFASKGYVTTGVDLSAFLISEANRLKKSKYKKYSSNLCFERKDMRHLEYRLEFDVVVNLFSSFGYFEKESENLKVIKSISRSLVKGGCFFFDFINADFLKKTLVPFDFKKQKDKYIIQSRHISGGSIVKDIIIFTASAGNKTFAPARYRESIKMYTAPYLVKMFEKCGFGIKKKFGDYAGNRFDKSKSERLILIAEKF